MTINNESAVGLEKYQINVEEFKILFSSMEF